MGTEAVRDYWQENPCAAGLARAEPGSPGFYADVEQAKLRLEPHEVAFADFPAWHGRDILEIGCGVGVDTTRFARAGAHVTAIDLTDAAVSLARGLLALEHLDATVIVADAESLPFADESFDLVYSWGVLHHTGALWTAVDLAAGRVGPGGSLMIAIYNDQGPVSRRWLAVKTAYNRLPRALRFLVVVPSFAVLWGPRFAIETLRLHPGRAWREYATTSRGMSPWRDVVDWVGGLPFEVARPDEVVAYCARRGFEPRSVTTQGRGHGCNEFVFRRARQEV